MGEFIGGIILEGIIHVVMWFFGTIVWNIWKGVGTFVRWCFFLWKSPIEEMWDHPDNALVGFLTLCVGGITIFKEEFVESER